MKTKVQVTGDPTSRSTLQMGERQPSIDLNFPIYNITSNTRVIMGMSHEGTDAGQTFLPFFDSQDIVLTVPAPLCGLELISYTSDGTPTQFGGFIRPRLTTINYLDYLLTMSNSGSVYEFDGKPELIFDAIRLHGVHSNDF